MRECVRHKQICQYYHRTTEQPICIQCKEEIERKQGGGGGRMGAGPAMDRHTMNQTMMSDDKSQHSSYKTNFYGGKSNQGYNFEKDKILKIDDYTNKFLDTVKSKFSEMETTYK